MLQYCFHTCRYPGGPSVPWLDRSRSSQLHRSARHGAAWHCRGGDQHWKAHPQRLVLRGSAWASTVIKLTTTGLKSLAQRNCLLIMPMPKAPKLQHQHRVSQIVVKNFSEHLNCVDYPSPFSHFAPSSMVSSDCSISAGKLISSAPRTRCNIFQTLARQRAERA